MFNCAFACRYEKCEVFGLSITARCDVAQDKYPILNYIPIVMLRDWLNRDGLDILVEQELKEQSGKLGSMLRQANLSPSLPLSVPLTAIADTHFPIGIGNKNQNSAAKKFREHVVLVEEFKNITGVGDTDILYSWFQDKRPKHVEDLVKRLSRHQVLGYYLLEEIWPDEEENIGYVCLLREVTTLLRSVAKELGRGLSSTKYEELCSETKNSTGLSIAQGELAMPVSLIGSPTIEHVLQLFSNLFGRIGVADPQDEVIQRIIGHCLSGDLGGNK